MVAGQEPATFFPSIVYANTKVKVWIGATGTFLGPIGITNPKNEIF
jgi:hypothetical protein